jgi:N-acetylglucosaminyl-diphospho-decaprenol L-rhamnosyltransferase
MDVSIIIVSYNSSRYLKTCIEAILQCDDKATKEIIIVDNRSKDDSVEIIKSIGKENVQLITPNKNIGFGGGNNFGAVIAKGDYLFFLNPDTIILSGCIDKLCKYMNQNQDTGIVGPKLLNIDLTVQRYFCNYYTVMSILLRRIKIGKIKFKYLSHPLLNDIKTPQELDWLLGSALFLKRTTFRRCNGFDERYKLYFEDVDLCRRIKQNGLKVIYYPNAKVIHYHQRESADNLSIKTLWHLQSAIRFFNKFGWKIR